ncbi:TAXI family TRAP transporter solute-binding subunit [Thiohalorhabdus methylotrophus]|uniref:TAXI family TRAP transporter solute-binding subunit n=1 Tax=Thiohalorhabdus methylotrophus TaxID=3242694 RepID=A0ABV4TSE3_9GAMM
MGWIMDLWERMKDVRSWIGWAIVAVSALSLLTWGYMRANQDRVVQVATAGKGGYYYQFGTILKRHVEKATEYQVELLETKGSVDNRSKLLKGQADMAILQTSAVSMENLRVVAPLWNDYIHFIVRDGSGIASPADISGKPFVLGPEGSGYRASSQFILSHYGIEPADVADNTAYFKELLTNDSLQGAIVTTSLMNPDLQDVMASGRFRLLSLPALEGVAFHNIYFRTVAIPRGVYATSGIPRPAEPTDTIATEAVLASTSQVPDRMVETVMNVLYSGELRSEAPHLTDRNPVTDSFEDFLNLHAAAKSFYEPYSGLGVFSNLIAYVDRFKEMILLGLIGIGVFLYEWRKKSQQKAREKLRKGRESVERLMAQLAWLERSQKETKDLRALQRYYDEAFEVKYRGLEETAHTGVQETTLFHVFLQECGNVISQLQWRMEHGSAVYRERPEEARTGTEG